MMTWLKKFVLDILPSVAATIIGAYIVNHYIIPKAQSANPQPSIASVISDVFGSKSADGAADKTASEKSSPERSAFERGVAEKAAIEKTVEKAASDKAAADKTAAVDKSTDAVSDAPAVETRKHHAPAKVAARPVVVPPAAAQDERRANDLARAAIERQRANGSSESGKTETAKAAEAPRVQPVSTVASAPAMQALPPAINVTAPSPDAFEQGNATPVMRQPYPQAALRSDDSGESRRFVPPADIPARRPLDLRAEAMSPSPSERTSIAQDVFSTAKSMFHAVIPR